MSSLLAAILTALLVALAEWLHSRRTARVRHMLFGRAGVPAPWALAMPLARCICCGLLVWGGATLLRIDGRLGEVDFKKKTEAKQHLVIALDVSPSMYIKDAGPNGDLPRNTRAGHVMQSLLNRLDMSKVRVSIVAFYGTAKPVVVDTADLNVVSNIIGDLPLEQAFKEGRTNMYAGVREAAKLAAPFQPGSATLVVISDGDTLPDSQLEAMPVSIADSLVLGVGNAFRASPVGDTSSRQDSASLRQLAARLRGEYFDGNTNHLPSDVLRGLAMLDQSEQGGLPLRTWALIAAGTGGVGLGVIWPLLARYGMPRAQRLAARATARASAVRLAPVQRGSAPAGQPPRNTGTNARSESLMTAP